MFCEQCGKRLEERSDFCVHCGTKIAQKDARLEGGSRKTISLLNEKAWYRFLKVVYISAFVIALAVGNLAIYFDYSEGVKSIDSEKTKVICNQQDEKTFALSDTYITLRDDDFIGDALDYRNFYTRSNDYRVKPILEMCSNAGLSFIMESDILVHQKAKEFLKSKGYSDMRAMSDRDMSDLNGEVRRMMNDRMNGERYLDYSVQQFDIIPVFTYADFLKLLFLVNLGIVVTFEILRRAFYYIILGTLRPSKQ